MQNNLSRFELRFVPGYFISSEKFIVKISSDKALYFVIAELG